MYVDKSGRDIPTVTVDAFVRVALRTIADMNNFSIGNRDIRRERCATRPIVNARTFENRVYQVFNLASAGYTTGIGPRAEWENRHDHGHQR